MVSEDSGDSRSFTINDGPDTEVENRIRATLLGIRQRGLKGCWLFIPPRLEKLAQDTRKDLEMTTWEASFSYLPGTKREKPEQDQPTEGGEE